MAELTLFGRLHPLVLHVPIGFVLAALVLELGATRGRLERRLLARFLWLSAAAAALAATTGLVLAREDGYGGATLARHQRFGLALAGACLGAALLHGLRARSLVPYRLALLAAALLLVPAGHLGATLTHGADWLAGPCPRASAPPWPPLTAAPPLPQPSDAPANASTDAEVVAGTSAELPAEVAAILAERCTSCHGPTKHKGGLRLDSLAAALAGGDSGPALVRGDPAGSLLLVRARLPLEHEDHMPPEEKPQPTADELARLAAWIAGEERAASAAEEAPVALAEEAPPAPELPEPEPERVALPPAAALAALDAAFVHHERLVGEGMALRIDVAPVAPSVGDAELAAWLEPLAPWIVELSLARSAIGDASLGLLARFPRLARLDLRATRVSAAGLAELAGLHGLERLVLAETEVGDDALPTLLALPALRALFTWRSRLSPAALARLAEARPELRLVTGFEPPAAELEVEGEPVFTSDRPVPGLAGEAALRPVNALCPVSGRAIDPAFAVVHAGAAGTRVVAFCCADCARTFWDEPARFDAALEQR
jgi:uncharacterized membrane protein